MKQVHRLLKAAPAILVLVAAGCGTADVATTDDLVPASVSLAAGNALAGVILSSDSGPGGGGVIRPELIDSLIVTVRRVEFLPSRRLHRCHPPVGDSIMGFRPGRPGPEDHDSILDDRPGGFHDGDGARPEDHPCARPGDRGPMGPGGPPPFGPPPPDRPDSIVAPPDSGWGSRPWHWFTLAVTGNGRVDLTNLPTDSSDGILLAAGDLPPGEYVAARLIITSATIWFNTEITTDSGVVLQPDSGYAVKLPRRGDGPMGILTRTGFTVPEGGGEVVLLFDPDVTIGHAVVTSNGTILIRPVLKPLRP